MTGQRVVFPASLEAVRQYIDDAVAMSIAKTAVTVIALREWCDKTEAAARFEPLSFTDSEAVFQARMQLIDEVRALLPPVHESGSPDP